MANILQAISRIVSNPIIEVRAFYNERRTPNSVGEAFEKYVKDVFADTFNVTNETERIRIYSEVFSYLGNQNNPPDIMLRGGDAVETKKIESPNSPLALNSSYPKSKLYADSPMIIDSCRRCEEWTIKDIVYAVGHTLNGNLRYLWLVYGDCFAASRERYERVWNAVSGGINNIPDIGFSETNELARINRVDPLGITYLRVRGMWGIENPKVVFAPIIETDRNARFHLNVLMRTEKFNSFPEVDRNRTTQLVRENYQVRDIRFRNPDNPAVLLDGKLITFKVV